MKITMSLLLILMLSGLVSVLSQSTLLDGQCDNECFLQSNVEIQRLAAMMERNINAWSEKKIMEVESKLINKNNELESKLQNQNDTIIKLLTKISEIESIESTTPNVTESSTSEDCEDIRAQGRQISGVYGVKARNGQTKRVYCEMSADGGAWTRILHRQDNLTEFVFIQESGCNLLILIHAVNIKPF